MSTDVLLSHPGFTTEQLPTVNRLLGLGIPLELIVTIKDAWGTPAYDAAANAILKHLCDSRHIHEAAALRVLVHSKLHSDE